MNAPLSEALAAYRARLEEIYGDRLTRLVLYGSRARGDAEPDPDIDVMIVLRGPLDDWAETQRTSKVTSEVSMRFETDIARMFCTPEDWVQKRTSFYESVRSEGVTV